MLIDVDDKGKANQNAKLLRQKPSVVLADAVTGPHDVIAVLEGWDMGEYNLQTLACIRKIEGASKVTPSQLPISPNVLNPYRPAIALTIYRAIIES